VLNPARLARWVSVVFDSPVLSLIIFRAIGWKAGGWVGVAWAIFALLILTGIPLAYIWLGQRRGWVSYWELSQRSERPRLILASISSDLFALGVMGLGSALP